MKKHKKLIFSIFTLIFLVIVIIVGVLFLYKKSPKQQEEKISIRLKWLHQAQFAGFYYAQQAGYYNDEGLNITLNPGGVDFPAIQIVSAGSENFGVAGADQILIAREKGVPIVVIAVLYRKNPVVFFSLKESNILKPQDFIGKRVGVKLGASVELSYRVMMRSLNIDMKAVKEIPVKYDMTPLFTGKVDVWPGYIINEPIVAQEQGYELNLIFPSDYGVNIYGDAIFTTEEIIINRPDLVKRFLRATLKGWKHSIDNQTKAVDYILMYSDNLQRKHEAAMIKASVGLLLPDDNPIGWMTKQGWEEMQRLLLEEGFMKQAVSVNDIFTLQFLEEIYGQ